MVAMSLGCSTSCWPGCGPLITLLAFDTAVSYYVGYFTRAHDRSLLEIAREVVLHVRANGSGPRLEMSPTAERVLLVNQDDLVITAWPRTRGC